MFKRKYRLPANFRLQKASLVSTPLFSVKIGKNRMEHNRYGIVVSKRIDKRASARNKIKRILRRFLEENHDIIPQGNDILVIAKPAIVGVSGEKLHEQMGIALKKNT